MLRFGTAPYEYGFGELCKLKQTTFVRDYQSYFEHLLGKVRLLTNKQETACFISGLKEPLRAYVRAQNPTNLSTTISLAYIYKGKSLEVKKGPTEFKPMTYTKKSPVTSSEIVKNECPMSRFTPLELQIMLANICFGLKLKIRVL